MQSVGTGWLWLVFSLFVFSILFCDLFLINNNLPKRVSTKSALGWTLIWIACALAFNLFFWVYLNHTIGPSLARVRALEFFTGYLIEESLSFDNMFVILMIFSYFNVPAEYQRRILTYGVLGAIVLRLIMIFAGTWLIAQFHWLLYIFGIFLIFTGFKMLMMEDKPKDFANNFLLQWVRRYFRVTNELHDEKFFINKQGKLFFTPLFLVVVCVEFSDLIFSLDSIPAIFAITLDPFIVFTSNIFAILGLRSIYFLLANLASSFHLLKYGIALILIFIGLKMCFEKWLDIPIFVTLAIVMSILITTIILSFLGKKNVSKH